MQIVSIEPITISTSIGNCQTLLVTVDTFDASSVQYYFPLNEIIEFDCPVAWWGTSYSDAQLYAVGDSYSILGANQSYIVDITTTSVSIRAPISETTSCNKYRDYVYIPVVPILFKDLNGNYGIDVNEFTVRWSGQYIDGTFSSLPSTGNFGHAQVWFTSSISFTFLPSYTPERSSAVEDILNASPTPPVPDTDPYSPGGFSDHTGGGGGFDSTSDPVDFPSLPTLSAIGTGFVTLYVPTTTQIQNLAQYMWNADLATLDFWKKIVADPIDLILGLNIVPVSAPVAGQRSVNVGFIDTGVSMNYTNSQYVEVDCGSIQVPEYWGAYLDYSPYTRIEIYLPYCGYHAIDADEVVGKTVHVKYHVDIISGSLVAYVKCDNSVLYEFAGSCASSIPVTSSQYGDQVIAAATLFAQVVSLPAAGMAASAGAAGAAKAMQAAGENPDNYRKNIEAANVADQWADAASTITKMKPNIARSGVIGGMAGQLSIQKPYLVITRPRQSLPSGQNRYKGYPSNITSKLGDLSGFTEVSNIHLENIPCTLDEQTEIDQFLKTGVII